MELRGKRITRKLKEYKEIGKFMKRVFPKEELMAMWLISIITAVKQNYKFVAYYDKELFVGLSLIIENKEEVFLFYIAVNDEIHSKGYGSAILSKIQHIYKDRKIVLFIETMDPKAKNYEQRVKRLAFYKRNGFHDTDIKAGVKTTLVDVLANDPSYSVAQCKKMLRFMPLKVIVSS